MNVTEIGINKSRIQCESNGYRQRDSAEHEGYDGALTEKRITENNITNADSRGDRVLEQILSSENLNRAYKQVKKNKGAHGVDGMKIENRLQHLKDNGNELKETIRNGKYSPSPVRRVEIPKDNGKMRKLGIPTAVDRVIQQGIMQVLSPMFEPLCGVLRYGECSPKSLCYKGKFLKHSP